MSVTTCTCVLRLTALIKDYCGSLSEKSVQMNFALIYELLDEVVVSLPASGVHAQDVLGYYGEKLRQSPSVSVRTTATSRRRPLTSWRTSSRLRLFPPDRSACLTLATSAWYVNTNTNTWHCYTRGQRSQVWSAERRKCVSCRVWRNSAAVPKYLSH